MAFGPFGEPRNAGPTKCEHKKGALRHDAGARRENFVFIHFSSSLVEAAASTYTSAECSAGAVGGRGATRWVVVMGNEFTGLPVRLLDGR